MTTSTTIQRCRTCGAEVVWLKNEQTGKAAPINARPVDLGNIAVNLDAGTYRTLRANEMWDYRCAHPGQTYLSHYATCPQAATWRKHGSRRP